MACNEWHTKLDRYLDAELSSAEAAALDEHLAGCSDCATRALAAMKLKRAVQQAARVHHPSAEFRRKIRSQISPRATSRRPWFSLALATVCLVAVLVPGSYLMLARVRTNQLVSEIADLHTSNLASSQPVDVISTDRHTVKPWFQGKVPFTFNIPELNGTDFKLVGGRVVFIERETAAMLLFQYGGHYLSVYVLPDRAPLSGLGNSTRRQAAFNLKSWEESGLRFILITDTDSGQAQRLADLLTAANRQ